MTDQTGPRCGNNPNFQMSDGDRKVVAEFQAYLADRTALRDRIAEALYANDHPGHLVPLNETGMGPAYQASATAVLRLLPPPADRAAVLRELEERYRGYARDSAHPDFRAAYAAVANDLSRLADEAQQQPETPGCPGYKGRFQTVSDAKRRYPNCKHCGKSRAEHQPEETSRG